MHQNPFVLRGVLSYRFILHVCHPFGDIAEQIPLQDDVVSVVCLNHCSRKTYNYIQFVTLYMYLHKWHDKISKQNNMNGC